VEVLVVEEDVVKQGEQEDEDSQERVGLTESVRGFRV